MSGEKEIYENLKPYEIDDFVSRAVFFDIYLVGKEADEDVKIIKNIAKELARTCVDINPRTIRLMVNKTLEEMLQGKSFVLEAMERDKKRLEKKTHKEENGEEEKKPKEIKSLIYGVFRPNIISHLESSYSYARSPDVKKPLTGMQQLVFLERTNAYAKDKNIEELKTIERHFGLEEDIDITPENIEGLVDRMVKTETKEQTARAGQIKNFLHRTYRDCRKESPKAKVEQSKKEDAFEKRFKKVLRKIGEPFWADRYSPKKEKGDEENYKSP